MLGEIVAIIELVAALTIIGTATTAGGVSPAAATSPPESAGVSAVHPRAAGTHTGGAPRVVCTATMRVAAASSKLR
jgi:hypothetical protein